MTSSCRKPAHVLAALLVLGTGWLAAAQYEIPWYTVDGGGDVFTTGGDFTLSGTIGQPDASLTPMTGGGFTLVGGFWAAAPAPGGAGDCDGNGVVGTADFATIADCLAGPDVGVATGCDCADLDADQDSDLADIALYQQAVTGP